MSRPWIIGSVLLGAAGLGAWYYYRRQIAELENIQADITGIQVKNLAWDTPTTLILTMKLTSNSRIEAKISKYSLDITAGPYVIANLSQVPGIPVIIPAKGFSMGDVSVSFIPAKVFQELPDLAKLYSYSGNLPVIIKGKVRVRSAFVSLNIPVEYDTDFNTLFGALKIPDLLKKAIGLL